MNITVSSVLLMILMVLSVLLIIVSAIFLDGVIKVRPKDINLKDVLDKNGTTPPPRSMDLVMHSIDIEFPKESDKKSEKNPLTKVNDINLACCSLCILVALVQFISSILLLFKILPKLFWAIAEIICTALLMISFGLALTYAMWLVGINLKPKEGEIRESKMWSNGRHEAFVAFVAMNALFIPPTIVHIMFVDTASAKISPNYRS